MVDVDESNNVLFLPLDQLTAAALASERRQAENGNTDESLASTLSRTAGEATRGFERPRR